MKVTVKDLKHNSHELDNVDPEQTVGAFGQTVKELFKFPDGVRLIYCGRILDNNKKLSEYFTENNTGFIVCMPQALPKSTQSTQTQSIQNLNVSQNASTNVSPNASTNVSPNANQSSSTTAPTTLPTTLPSTLPTLSPMSSNTQTYTVDQIRAMMVVFARVLKVSPDLFYMFSTNDTQFQNFMLSPTFSNDILAPLLQSSNMIVNALQNGTDINVPIPIFGRRNNNTNTTNLNTLNTLNTTNTTNTTNLNTLNMTTTNPGSTGNLPQTYDTYGDNNNLFTETEDMNTTLTEDDHKNIQELCQFGFPIDIVTQTYILTNRNKELAATMLFEFGG